MLDNFAICEIVCSKETTRGLNMKHIPFDFCDECPDGQDRYPVDDLSYFGDDRLCPVHAASRAWKPGELLDDSYDRITKCEDDR